MQPVPRLRVPVSRPGAGAALAARLGALCAAGIELRARGACAAPDRREFRHALRGHDAGCRALGLPLADTERVLRKWDAGGAAGLLIEALREAVEEIGALGAGWSPELAHEIVGYAIARRITPRSEAPRRAGTHVGPRLPMESRPDARIGSSDQIPRFAAKSPASRRWRTWPRKRAASAPSMMR